MFISRAFRRITVTIRARPGLSLVLAFVFFLAGISALNMLALVDTVPPENRTGLVGIMWTEAVLCWALSAALFFVAVRNILRAVRTFFS